MVRLKEEVVGIAVIEHPVFQFHNGSIKSRFCQRVVKPIFCFNSTMVRLKEICRPPSRQRLGSFNSTMVRLKAGSHHATAIGINLFQFHNGSIKRVVVLQILALDEEFQFHNGSIKSKLEGSGKIGWGPGFNSTMVRLKVSHSPLMFTTKIGFNSTMVRLKAAFLSLRVTLYELFQFHNGSIKSHDVPRLLPSAAQFQFHNGSIKSRSRTTTKPSRRKVSIPQWFD